jgi:hypothetical protein
MPRPKCPNVALSRTDYIIIHEPANTYNEFHQLRQVLLQNGEIWNLNYNQMQKLAWNKDTLDSDTG